MIKKILGTAIMLICAAAFVSAQVKTSKTSEDETAIRANVKQLETGWSMKNGAELAKPFAENADFVVINGMHLKGRPAIAQNHQRIFDTIYKNTTLILSVEQIRFLHSDIAIAHVQGELKLPQGDAIKTIYARLTLVMMKNKDKWEIAAFQNTEIQQPKN